MDTAIPAIEFTDAHARGYRELARSGGFTVMPFGDAVALAEGLADHPRIALSALGHEVPAGPASTFPRNVLRNALMAPAIESAAQSAMSSAFFGATSAVAARQRAATDAADALTGADAFDDSEGGAIARDRARAQFYYL